MTNSRNNPTCETCRFFEPHFACGQCRRHSPILLIEDVPVTKYPATRPYEWCGDHEPIKADERPFEHPLGDAAYFAQRG